MIFGWISRSLVAFGPKQRAIGEAAKTQEVSNFKNTIGSLKRLIGRSAADPEVTEVEQKFVNPKLIDVNGTVGIKVRVILLDHLWCGYGGRVMNYWRKSTATSKYSSSAPYYAMP